MFIVYQAKNLINGKLYIGQTSRGFDVRIKEHERPCRTSIISKAIQKHGKDNFEWSLLTECVDVKEANFIEEFLIKHLKTHTTQHGYNVHLGGNNQNGYERSAEQIEANRQRQKKPVICLETMQVFDSTYDAYEWVSGTYGSNAIGRACNGKAKIAYGYNWRWWNPDIDYSNETLNENLYATKPVVCIETGQVFPTAKDACIFFMKPEGNGKSILKVCKGRRKTAIGYKWAYYEEE